MKPFVILLFISVILHAESYTLKLYEKLLSSLFETPITLFADKENRQILQKSNLFNVQDRCDRSVKLLVGSKFTTLPYACRYKPLFATTYRAYTHYPNAFGAFYWRKGRPQIHFKKTVLEHFRLKLPENLKRFIDE